MSLFDKIKLSFGFGPDVDPDDPLFNDSSAKDHSTASSPSAQSKEIASKPLEFDKNMQDAIFTKIVDVFNQSLPSFLQNSVNRDAQIKYLRQALDEGVEDYMNALVKSAQDYCNDQWQAKQNDMAHEINAIRRRAEEVEKQSNEMQQKQLSADRQKRALTERVHDLESQISRLASEREQFELENRSLINRLKVASVQQEEVDKIRTELEESRSELNRIQNDPSLIAQKRESELNNQIEKLNEAIKNHKEQIRVAEEMRIDLSNKLRQAECDIESRNNEIAQLNELVSAFDEATARMEKSEQQIIEATKVNEEKLAEKDNTIAELRRQLNESIEREKAFADELEDLRNSKIPTVEIGTDDDIHTSTTHGDESLQPSADDRDDDVMTLISDIDLTEIAASFEANQMQRHSDNQTEPQNIKHTDKDVSEDDSLNPSNRQKKPNYPENPLPSLF